MNRGEAESLDQVTSITRETPGTFAVVTASGTIYILNPQKRWVQRQSTNPDGQLRKDGDRTPLVKAGINASDAH
jgi:hypothetical protein